MSLVNSKSLLAKLLATENITVETRKVPTASFDLKNRVLTIPDWEGVSSDGYDLLLGHEVSHALNTPYDGWSAVVTEKPYLQHFLNVVEDSRIEKRIKRKYPGLRRSFFNGYAEFMKKDLFGLEGRELDDMFFIDRLNIFCKVGSLVDIEFTPEEEVLVKMVEDAETFEDARVAAEAVYAYSKIEQQEQKKKKEESGESDEEEDYDDESESIPSKAVPGDGVLVESEEGEESDESDSETADAESEEGEEGEEGEECEECEESASEGTKNPEPNDDLVDLKDDVAANGVDGESSFVPTCETDENFEKLRETLATLDGLSTLYVNIPKPDLKRIVTPASRVHELLKKDFGFASELVAEFSADFKNRNSRYIDLLAKEFEMRKAAKSYAKNRVANTGDIDIGKIYKYRTDDNIFRRIMTTPKGKNHGIVILLDRSASMVENMKGSLEQLVVMAQFCKRVGVPFVVYGFGSNKEGYCIDNNTNEVPNMDMFSRNDNDYIMKNVYLREYLNSKMNKTTFNEACNNIITLSRLYESTSSTRYVEKDIVQPDGTIVKDYRRLSCPRQEQLSSTPLNEALIALAPITKAFKENGNLEIVSTVIIQDGDSDSPLGVYVNKGESLGYSWFNKYKEKLIISDKINGKVFQEQVSNDYGSLTKTLLNWYSEYTQTKVVGFFIMNSSQTKKSISDICVDMQKVSDKYVAYSETYTKLRGELRDNRFLVAPRDGYRKFFYISGGSSLSDNGAELEIDSDMAVSKIKTAFLKNNQKKLTNRALVTQLISEISA